jgi:hypothetical protein
MTSSNSTDIKFIIFAPRGLKTGGPEGMHQLAWAINTFGYEAKLLAWPKTKKKLPVKEYQKYQPEWCRVSAINKKDIFIISESIKFLPFWYFFFISKNRIYMWMHSVDFSIDKSFNQYEKNNYVLNSDWQVRKKRDSSIKKIARTIGLLRIYWNCKSFFSLMKKKFFKLRIEIPSSNYIFASYYSQNIATKIKHSKSDILLHGWANGMEIENLQDLDFCSCPKSHIAFNPGKSKELIERILDINAARNMTLHFVPIAGIRTDREVYKLLSSCDLYLDLGFFPGLERTPREAIKMDCPVLLAKRGAARFYKDFPLPSLYLLNLELLDTAGTYESILKILSIGKQNNLNNQKEFKNHVSNEKSTFLKEVLRFINLIRQLEK